MSHGNSLICDNLHSYPVALTHIRKEEWHRRIFPDGQTERPCESQDREKAVYFCCFWPSPTISNLQADCFACMHARATNTGKQS